jgi:hypothetical protein
MVLSVYALIVAVCVGWVLFEVLYTRSTERNYREHDERMRKIYADHNERVHQICEKHRVVERKKDGAA